MVISVARKSAAKSDTVLPLVTLFSEEVLPIVTCGSIEQRKPLI